MNPAPVRDSVAKESLYDDRVWRRILQSATYAFSPQKLIGGSLVVDPAIAQMNDLARITELTARSPMSIALLLSDRPPQTSGAYWPDNVFTWNSQTGAFHAPPLFMSSYKRFPLDYGLLVAPLSVTIGSATIWNWLVFDPDLKQLDRIDTDATSKPALDSQIETFLTRYDLPYKYRSDAQTRAVYQELIAATLLDFECPQNIHLNIWGYWLLDLRLFFARNSQDDIFAEMKRRLSGGIDVSNLLLNFYPDFTSDANLHTFGSDEFLAAHTSKNDLWQYEPLVATRVAQLTGFGCGRSQLNQLLSAALRDFVTQNGGDDYRKLFQQQVGVAPRYVPNDQDAGGWIPKEQLDPTILAIFATNKLRFGYVDGPPYVFRDPGAGQLTGLDHALGGLIAAAIAHKYGVTLEADWVEVQSSGAADSVAGNLVVLYQGLVNNQFDSALSGQMILRGSQLPAGVDPEWTTATAMLFTNITYTGKAGIDSADIEPLKNRTRDDLIALLAEKYPDTNISFFSVTNPGPSYHSTTNLVRDLNAKLASAHAKTRGIAAWVSGTVAESTSVSESQLAHFTVGDSIAGGYQTKVIPDFKGIYLAMPAVQTPSIWNDPDVGSATLLPLAAFTLRPKENS